MISIQVIINLITILTTAVISGIIAKKLKQPLILGYLIGGMIIGMFTGIGRTSKEEISLFAEIGIALLMFLLGIEFSFRRFKRVGTIVIWGATLQILATILLGTFIFRIIGLDFFSSLFLGTVFSLSSTAIVVKILGEQGMIASLFGEISIGWLLLQDLAVLPIVILLPVINASSQEPTILGSLYVLSYGVVKGALFISLILLIGKYAVTFIFDKYAKLMSRELLLLASFTLCIILAGITQSAGFSFALGAFLAGVLVSRTSVLQAVFSEIRPIRDLFSTIFFVSLGFLINPLFIKDSFATILVLVVLVIFIKFMLVFGITFLFGYHSRIAFLTAVTLISVGEFAFVLAQLGLSEQMISEYLYSLILSVAIITFIFTPPIIKYGSYLYRKIYPFTKKFHFLRNFFEKKPRPVLTEDLVYRDHVIIFGYGRVGSYIGRALQLENIPFVVVDYNHFVVEKLKEQGMNAIFGDPSNFDLLKFLSLPFAKAAVIAVPDFVTQETIITNVLTVNKTIKIYCRTHYEEDQALIKAMGAYFVVHPEFEASLSIINKLLLDFRIEKEEIQKKVVRLKIEHGIAK
ncbi:MAG: cation:proton antiporter [Patescibacteria group bacterium]|nr:cation:proton antiporter [Patescibacteria group bacterium]